MALSSEDVQRLVYMLRDQSPGARALLIKTQPLDDGVKILREFGEAERGEILSYLPARQAKELSAALAEQVEIPEPLVDEILRGNCVLFVGAGVSLDAGMPSSRRLVRALGHGPRTSLAVAAQRFEEERNRNALEQTICREFERANEFLQPQKASHRFIANIPQLTSLIVTTNYDTLLEDALRREGQTPVIIRRETELAAFTNQSPVVVKLHGDIDQPETMIVTRNDYARLAAQLREPGGFGSFLANLLATRTMIFVGFSMADEDFLLIRNFITARMVDAVGRQTMRVHYAVLPWEKDKTQVLQTQAGVEVIQGGAQEFFAAIFRRASDFVNRTEELQQICRIQQEPFVEIVGPAGSGKTMLLRGIETFYRTRRNYDPIIRIDLKGQETTDDLLRKLAEHYKLDISIAERGPDPAQMLQQKAKKLAEELLVHR